MEKSPIIIKNAHQIILKTSLFKIQKTKLLFSQAYQARVNLSAY